MSLPIHLFWRGHKLNKDDFLRNAVTTATQLRTNRFLEASPYALDFSRSIMSEVINVARAKGLVVPEGTVDRLIKQCTDVKEGLPSSMMFDYLAGRPMEVEVSGFMGQVRQT